MKHEHTIIIEILDFYLYIYIYHDFELFKFDIWFYMKRISSMEALARVNHPPTNAPPPWMDGWSVDKTPLVFIQFLFPANLPQR